MCEQCSRHGLKDLTSRNKVLEREEQRRNRSKPVKKGVQEIEAGAKHSNRTKEFDKEETSRNTSKPFERLEAR